MYSYNRLNLNKMPHSFPRSAYSTCRTNTHYSPSRALLSAVLDTVYIYFYYISEETDSRGLKVLCSYKLTAMLKFALLRYLSEFRLRVSSF